MSAKEHSLFKTVVKHYEGKQYKKGKPYLVLSPCHHSIADSIAQGLKAADQILRSCPNHGDTQAMKALILNSLGQQEEAFALAKLALKNDMRSHVAWHVYGLLYRSQKNYEEAVKAYKFALKIEPSQQNILRDLALLQMQMRDYAGYIDSRRKILKERPSLRQNWTALAVAYHLTGDYAAALKILETYEGTLKQPPPRTDLEHSEALLYRNTIIADSGDIEGALKHLEEILKNNLDRTAILELRAKYLLQLGRKEEAEKAYRTLLDRNSEYRAYFDGLEHALGLDKADESSHTKLKELYDSYAAKNERNDAARRIPLDFLKGGWAYRTINSYTDEFRGRFQGRRGPVSSSNVK